MSSCPCGLGEPYQLCCGRFHAGNAEPPSALLLMRARYSAFAEQDADFLIRTWHPQTRPASFALEPRRAWTGLQILGHTGGGMFEAEGSVEFTAYYQQDGRAAQQHENSRFVRVDGHWRYLGTA